MEILLEDWNISGELSLQSFAFLDDEKLKTFWGTTGPSQRGFLQLLDQCALQICLPTLL